MLGNDSESACAAVQVDASPPSVEVECPATAILRTAGVSATVTATDGQSGLARDPSGVVHLDTSALGAVTTSRTAVDNVGHEAAASCTTDVVYSFSKLKPRDGKTVKLGHAVKVSFSLSDALGYNPNGSATLEAAPVSGPKRGSTVRPARLRTAATASPTNAMGVTATASRQPISREASGTCASTSPTAVPTRRPLFSGSQ